MLASVGPKDMVFQVMNKRLAILHAMIVIFFVGLLGYSTMAVQHLRGLASEFAIQKTEQHVEQIVTVGSAVLEAVDERGWISGAQQKLFERELDEFWKDPYGFLTDVTKANERKLPRIGQMKKLLSIKQELRTYYDSVVSSLLSTVRIFAGTNIVAGLVGLIVCLWYRNTKIALILWFSISLCLAVFYGCWLFVDSLSFFSILFRFHMGWSYPCYVIAACVLMFSEVKSRMGDTRQSTSANTSFSEGAS